MFHKLLTIINHHSPSFTIIHHWFGPFINVTNFNGKTKTPACWPIPFSSNASNATTPGTPTLSVARAVWVAPGCRSFGRQTWCISQVNDNRVPQDISSMPIQILSIYDFIYMIIYIECVCVIIHIQPIEKWWAISPRYLAHPRFHKPPKNGLGASTCHLAAEEQRARHWEPRQFMDCGGGDRNQR